MRERTGARRRALDRRAGRSACGCASRGGRRVRRRLLARDRRRRPRLGDRRDRVGAARPYRGSRNGRGLAFFYADDPQVGTRVARARDPAARGGHAHARLPVPRGPDARPVHGPGGGDPAVPQGPGRDAGRGCSPRTRSPPSASATRRTGTKMRSTGSVAAFFRRSSGPGWALAGDAGHFKDPVIGQGMRDAMRFGRAARRGRRAGRSTTRPRLDRALLEAERRRDRECLASYHWGNRESRIMPVRRCSSRRRCATSTAPSPPHLMRHVRPRARAAPRAEPAARRAAGARARRCAAAPTGARCCASCARSCASTRDIWREELTRPVPPDARVGVRAARTSRCPAARAARAADARRAGRTRSALAAAGARERWP